MATHIIAISRSYPQHWAIARQHEYWDMPQRRSILQNDLVYFWLPGSGLVGQVRVTSDARDLDESDDRPWEDPGTWTYKQRFAFSLISAEPQSRPIWSDVKDHTGIRTSPNWGPHTVQDEDGRRWLWQVFARTVDSVEGDSTQAQLEELLRGKDTRDRQLRAIALRRGQPAFRKALLSAYQRRCAVTGSAVEQVLEAAHISPYRGEHTHLVANGLLLRSDVHTLFDQLMVTVTPNYTVRISPELNATAYAGLDGRRISLPKAAHEFPGAAVLTAHNDLCEWLV